MQPTVDNRLHFLPTAPEVFRNIALGLQHAVVLADRWNVILLGDQLVFRERRGERFTDEWMARRVTDRIEGGAGTGIESGFALLSFNTPAENESAVTRLRREVELWKRRGVTAHRYFDLLAEQHRQTRPVPAVPT